MPIMRNDPLEPSMTLNLGKSIEIVKFHLDKPDFSVPMKTLAIEKIARMETHNSVTKDDLLLNAYGFCLIITIFEATPGGKAGRYAADWCAGSTPCR